jgi:transglutaminase-like putative cysteine protease
MILRIYHSTQYMYAAPAFDSYNEVRLMPMETEHQRVRRFELAVAPRVRLYDFDEPGGRVHHFKVSEPHLSLQVFMRAEVETYLANPWDGLDTESPDLAAYRAPEWRQRFAEYLIPSPLVPSVEAVTRMAASIAPHATNTLDYLQALAAHIHHEFRYDTDATHVHTTVEEVLHQRAGVCQDFAHLMICACRSRNIPARYVSGYLYIGGAPEMRGEAAMHAWVECTLPGGAWVGIDPTNNLLANDRYVRVFTGRDYGDVVPTRGIYTGGATVSLQVAVQVEDLNPVSHR